MRLRRAWTGRISRIAFGCVALLPLMADAQDVYRCPDVDGGVLYMDAPCREGVKLDLLPGKPDPAAIARLQREHEAFMQRQAAREALEFERELWRESAAVRWAGPVLPTDAGVAVGVPWWFYGGGSGYLPRAHKPPGPPPPSRSPDATSRPPAPSRSYVPAR